MSTSIAITGVGVICSIGTDKAAVFESLKNNRHGIRTPKQLNTRHKELYVGEVSLSNEEMKAMLGVNTEKDISRTSLLGAIALKQAIIDAGLSFAELKGKRVALISGTTVGGMDVTERHYARMLVDVNEAPYIINQDCGYNTEEIARLIGLECEIITISTACSSALNAIILGTRMLLNNEVDYVFAGGSEALSLFHLNGFNSLMILDSDLCKPFDANRGGLNLGEGAAYVSLQKAEKADPKNIIGYIAGFGNRCDAFHQTATSPEGEGAFLAMRDALEMSGLSGTDIDYINAHGTGTPDNDKSESQAMIRLFGQNLPAISSTKSFTGHTTSASGAIETVICLLAMENGVVPANLRFENKDPECVMPSSGINGLKIKNVLCNSFGFGGNDSSLIITSCGHDLGSAIQNSDTQILAQDEIQSIEDLAELRSYVSPSQSRRMNKLMKAALLTACRTLQKAGIEKPDAIIIGTRFGMLEMGEKILTHLSETGEEGISPTHFMQSTHNTIAGLLAMHFKCHGYNITYTQGENSFKLALEDAKRLIAEGKANNVLIGMHDYFPEKFRSLYKSGGFGEPIDILSKSVLVSKR